MSHGRSSQAHAAEEAAPADAGTPLPVVVRRPLPRPRRPASQVTFLPFGSFVPADVDWYQVALWWRNLYFANNAGYLRAQHIADTWRERSYGWRSLYYTFLANVSPAPAPPAGAVHSASAYEPACARNRSRASRSGTGATPY